MERCAIVGSGLAGLCAYAALRRGGLEPTEVAVFGDDADPAATWRMRAAAIRQREMRSESSGHCQPSSFPGLAVRAALRRRSPVPLARTACDRYRPTVSEFLAHVEELRARSGWDLSFTPLRVRSVRAADGGFEVEGLGPFRHVLVAPGHPGLALPAELRGDPRAVHAYEPHEYADRVAVVGAGMAAATEWLNALAAGSSVVSVRRRDPERRPLNVPRPLLTKRGLAAFHAAPAEERERLLRAVTAPSYPPGRGWDAPLAAAEREGRFRVERSVCAPEQARERDQGSRPAEPAAQPLQVICATGFRRGFAESALLTRLVAEHGLETASGWIVLAPDSTVPALTDGTRTLALAGVPAQWAFPAADTLMGAKYAARRFLTRVKACPTR